MKVILTFATLALAPTLAHAKACTPYRAATFAQAVAGYETGTRNTEGFKIQKLEAQDADGTVWFAEASYLPLPNADLNQVRLIFRTNISCTAVLEAKRLTVY